MNPNGTTVLISFKNREKKVCKKKGLRIEIKQHDQDSKTELYYRNSNLSQSADKSFVFARDMPQSA